MTWLNSRASYVASPWSVISVAARLQGDLPPCSQPDKFLFKRAEEIVRYRHKITKK
jgi:hypothetical protein